MRSRKPIHALSPDEERGLLAAFDALISSRDPNANYKHWGLAHASFGVHGSAMFLAWHRAFILAFEDALRAATADASLALPYWDWVAVPRLPDLLQNPVFDALAPDRYTDEVRAAEGLFLPTQAMVDEAMALRHFAYFGGSTCTSGPGKLESVHGYPHSWVGPWMRTRELSAFDPAFWFHHSNVDRLWAEWQTLHPGQTGPCQTRRLAGIPDDPTVADMQDIASLDYEYIHETRAISSRVVITGGPGVRMPFIVPRTGRVELRLDGLHAVDDGPGPAEVLVFLGASDVPFDRFSLFGVTDGGDVRRAPDILDLHGADHARHSAHGLSIRINLTDFVDTTRGEWLNVRLLTNGGSRTGRGQVGVQAISVAAVTG